MVLGKRVAYRAMRLWVVEPLNNSCSLKLKRDMKPKNQKTLVKRVLVALLSIGIASFMVLTSCEKTSDESSDQQAAMERSELTAMSSELMARDSMIEELVSAFDKVDANLEIIREKETRLREWAEGEEIIGDREDRIVRDIQIINTLMADNRDEIAKLRERLRKSGISLNSLETRLNHMELANQEKTAELESLKEKLANAETSLAGLHDTLTLREIRVAMQEEVINTQSAVIKAQDSKMHEAYIATGSFKELKERGLVDKKGALFGVIGGEKAFTAKTNPEEFVTIDQRDQVRIPVYSKKVELITPHPEGSYELETADDGKVSAIDILKPDAFWQSSRYLIVATE